MMILSVIVEIGFAAINTVLRYARNDRHCEERSDEAISNY